jgi:hypothetical protein
MRRCPFQGTSGRSCDATINLSVPLLAVVKYSRCHWVVREHNAQFFEVENTNWEEVAQHMLWERILAQARNGKSAGLLVVVRKQMQRSLRHRRVPSSSKTSKGSDQVVLGPSPSLQYLMGILSPLFSTARAGASQRNDSLRPRSKEDRSLGSALCLWIFPAGESLFHTPDDQG